MPVRLRHAPSVACREISPCHPAGDHVHLSADRETALRVGGRRGVPVVLVVDAAGMHATGHPFYRSANGVWLADHVPPAFLR
ncbi:RNA 2'-phosphotransferase [Nonomuraea typhae]|uniref:RNA 2'-phosphotransferase n=1 Tax=Nonomuraea typhae TaxID=2603600 RepID=UPI0031B5C9F7